MTGNNGEIDTGGVGRGNMSLTLRAGQMTIFYQGSPGSMDPSSHRGSDALSIGAVQLALSLTA